ncbi:MAG TPA: ABC transporter permease [Candidatus Saccharimonadales bacterium]|nr:ABC transporter permease [Candidatus Saccharimonadales bacterium]
MTRRSHSLFTISTFAKVSIRRYFRDRVALFFTVLFPLIFLFVFGSFSKSNDISFHIALINQSREQFAQQFVTDIKNNNTFKVDKGADSLAKAKDKMSRSEVDVAILLPPDFGVVKGGLPTGQAQIYFDENNDQAARTIQSVLQGEFESINSKLVKTVTPFSVRAQSTNSKGLTRLDYTVAGLIGFSILGLGIFGPVNYFPQMKKQGVLRRLHITPLRVWEFFVSSVLSNSVIGLFSIAIMIAVATAVFHFHIIGNYLELAVVIVLGILMIFGIGLAIGGWAKNENQAAPLANIIVFPMMFLSGTFFPRFLMPEWLQHITTFLPLTPVIDAIRLVATEGKHLGEIGPQLGLVAIWTVIIYAIAFRVFRWE